MASIFKRGKYYQIAYYQGTSRKIVSLKTSSYQIALAKKREFEAAQDKGIENPLPTQTAIGDTVQRYADYIRARKTAKSAQNEIYNLRTIFGPVCPALEITSRKITANTIKKGNKSKNRYPVIEVRYLEEITPQQISAFISEHVRAKGLSPKTANRYREGICRLFSWATTEGGIRLPGSINPTAKVAKYREKAPEISFLTLSHIDDQLEKLKNAPQMQVMVAMYIYAGLRREELLWLTREDIDFKSGGNGLIRIRAKTINGEFWEPKTKVNRAIPISHDLRRYLDNYKPRPSIGGWFFPSPGGVRYDPDNFSRDLQKIQRQYSLKWSCLDFRHTFGSQLAMKGESLYKISKLMGNSPEICRKHYAAIIPESLTDCVNFTRKQPTLSVTG